MIKARRKYIEKLAARVEEARRAEAQKVAPEEPKRKKVKISDYMTRDGSVASTKPCV